jgi:type I restriction enzyme, S subunit
MANIYFIHAILSSIRFRQGVIDRASGGTGMMNISSRAYRSIPVPLPPLPEQKKIAQILSTWDEAIEQTRMLLAAAQRRKKALMQQLLTGKKRLAGFRGRTTIQRLHLMVKERSERWRNIAPLPVLSVTNDRGFVPQGEQFERRVASDDLNNYKVVRRGWFAYNPSRINVGSIDLLRTHDAGLLSPMYVVFETNPDRLLPEYLAQQTKSFMFAEQVRHLTQGSVRDSLGFDGLGAIKIFAPHISEQHAIAAVLAAADDEIKALEAQRVALERQKKGLMQKLLTGYIRI